MVGDLIKYLEMIKTRIIESPDVPLDMLMEEITEMATENWLKTGNPKLNDKQIDKAVVKVMIRKQSLN